MLLTKRKKYVNRSEFDIRLSGWHRRLNAVANRRNLDLYQLVSLLFREAQFVAVEVVLIGDHRLSPQQRAVYSRIERRLLDMWQSYEQGVIGASDLLDRCSYIYEGL